MFDDGITWPFCVRRICLGVLGEATALSGPRIMPVGPADPQRIRRAGKARSLSARETEQMANAYRDNWLHLVDMNCGDLITMARQRAITLSLEPSANDHRNVINMLRHDFTNYDGRVQNAASDRLYAEILDAIAEDFPWLAGQCARDNATHFNRLSTGVQAKRWSYRDAAERQRVARSSAKALSIGSKVTVNWRRRQYEAEVVEVRRTRVKAQFPLEDGSVHLIDRPANEVQPL
jgi:hypothetical protein